MLQDDMNHAIRMGSRLALMCGTFAWGCGSSDANATDHPTGGGSSDAQRSFAGGGVGGGSAGAVSEAGSQPAGSSSWSRPSVPGVEAYPGDGQPCAPGAAYACACPDGSTGTMGCLATSGQYSACGCAGLAEYPGETCGANQCPYLTVDGIEFTAAHCCASGNECGMKNTSVFSDTCYPRYAEHFGERDETCDQPIAFVETRGCCRADNQCGLVLLSGSNWDELGCVEAVELANRMKQSVTLSLFLIGTGNGGALDGIQGRTCQYDGGDNGSYKPERYRGPQ